MRKGNRLIVYKSKAKVTKTLGSIYFLSTNYSFIHYFFLFFGVKLSRISFINNFYLNIEEHLFRIESFDKCTQ